MELALFSLGGELNFTHCTRDRPLFAVVAKECRGRGLGLAATLN